GRPRKPLSVLDNDLLYATVLKKRVNKNVVEIKTTTVFGDLDKVNLRLAKSHSKTINTSFIELINGNW
ncbi:MAG: hypothetical protein LBI10_11115, partial [Deltaproteobacteria bacterium]|nr:hypothetical protein [Deltaproteobacteria bacterium]